MRSKMRTHTRALVQTHLKSWFVIHLLFNREKKKKKKEKKEKKDKKE